MSFPPLLRQDYANHSHWGSELAALVACLLVLAMLKVPFLALWMVAAITQAVVALVAGLKERRDARNREFHTPEWADFWFTVRGGLHVTLPLLLLGTIKELI